LPGELALNGGAESDHYPHRGMKCPAPPVRPPSPPPKGVVLYKIFGRMFAIFEVARFAGVILKCDRP
jgi:hypothetical protein